MHHPWKSCSRPAFLTLAAFICVGLGNLPTPVFAVQPVHLLPIGDSITARGQYIVPLENLLTLNGYTPDLIANEGTPSAPINTIDSTLAARLNHPNVNSSDTWILLMIGINDLYNHQEVGAPGRLGTLISDIRTAAPQANLIVAKITPDSESGGGTWLDPLVRQYNQDIVSVIQGASGYGTKVRMVDMYTPFVTNPLYQSNPIDYFSDGCHPTAAGGAVMAGVWYQGITAAPEPGTLALSAIALISLSAYAWRRRR